MLKNEKNSDDPKYILDDQVGFLLRRASQRHLAIFAKEIADLTPTQFAALAKLCELGRVSQNQLGRMTAMDAATIKGVIDRLRKRGYVETMPDPNDKRRLFAQATLVGLECFRDYVASAHEITDLTLKPLASDEKAMLLSLLKKLT